jgi:K+-transporting ATPase ATPase A chain
MLEFIAFMVVLLLAVKPLGSLIHVLIEESPRAWMRAVERPIYRLCGVNIEEQMTWKSYLVALGLFNFMGLLFTYALQRVQFYLPGNPLKFPGLDPFLAFNTAVSFVTNTNWQAYGGETVMSFCTQMTALTVQNFVSAATGIAAMLVLARGLRRKNHDAPQLSESDAKMPDVGLGNFWIDLTRTTLYVLLPLSIVLALVLVWQGVPQTLSQPAPMRTLESATLQLVPIGPVASQVAIKQLGTNGGGFYNVNSAHPFENPTPLSNFLECVSILLLPAALCYTFGLALGDKRQGWAILAAMVLLFVPLTWMCIHAEMGNWEGKEVRFGPAASALWASATTAASNGSVNSMHDSFTALGGLIPMIFILFGEVVFGGVGCGVYGIVLHVIVAVFVAGLMVGRTPEYMGKKIQTYEIKMCSLGILVMPAIVLAMAAVAVVIPAGTSAVANSGVHGFSEILYACSSMGNNNGSAFAGLSANNPFYELVGGLVMLASRFWILVPVLAIAGSLGRKKQVPQSAGTLPTHTPLFVVWLAVVIVVVGALSFLPALALGPIAEHYQHLAHLEHLAKGIL